MDASKELDRILKSIEKEKQRRAEAYRKLQAGEPMTLDEIFLAGH